MSSNNEAEAAVPGEGTKEPEVPAPYTEEKVPKAHTLRAEARTESMEQKPAPTGAIPPAGAIPPDGRKDGLETGKED